MDKTINKGQNEPEEYRDILEALEEAGKVAPDPAFREAARQRVLAAVAEQNQSAAVQRKVIHFRPRRFWVRTLAAAAALGLIMTSVSFASTGALPGDTLYPVKRTLENGRLLLATNNAARAAIHLDLADRRQSEVAALLSAKRLNRLEQTLQDMNTQTEQAHGLVDPAAANQEALLSRLNNQITAEQHLLDNALKNPAAAVPALQRARQRVLANRAKVIDAVQAAKARREENLQRQRGRLQLRQLRRQEQLNPQPAGRQRLRELQQLRHFRNATATTPAKPQKSK